MKNLKLFVLAFVAFNLVFVSCKSDDDNDNGSENVMTIDGENFTVERGFLTSFGDNGNGSFDWDVDLLSDGFTIDINAQTATGVGATIYLDLNSDSATGLTPGVYTFSETREAFTWVAAEGILNYNIETDNGIFFDAIGGTVTVSGTGNNQLIEVDLVGPGNTAITATYRGTLESLID
ncbi:hypothetical protein [uncultured Dokdonia sp.]|uniref:hypothetical protein n=1 Tax=uncultured Dokdonia sp. TaxID=575653 RepID=UPI00260E58B4|nr:hypothetical protein [uncultured Dokdonia sp.]